MMSFPTSLPSIFPRLSYQIPRYDKDQELTHHLIPSITLNQNQNQRQRRNSHDNKLVSEIDRQEFEQHQRNVRIAVHGQTWLRPPGMEPYMSPGFYGDQEQQDTPAMPEETLLPEEDEDGFMLSEEEDEEGNVDEELEEELEEDEQDLDADIEAPSEASYLSTSPTGATATPSQNLAPGMLAATLTSPTTPSAAPVTRTGTGLEAFNNLLDMMTHGREIILDSEMNAEQDEAEEEIDLDAEVEDMDDELESSFVEGDSMEL